MTRYPTKEEKMNIIDGEAMERAHMSGIERKIDDIWMSSKKSFLEKMIEMEVESKTNLRNQLAKQGIVTGIQSTTRTKIGSCIGIDHYGLRAQYATWYRDHIERFVTGYANRYPVTFYLQDGRKTRTFLLDNVQLDIIFSYLTQNNFHIESTHSKF